MPLYEYQCEACGHRFETIQKFSDAPIDKCPQCGGAVRKLQPAPAFQFKGSGWYVTDYARKDSGAPAKEGAAPAGSKEAGSSDTDAKTAGKADGTAETKSEKKSEKKNEAKSDAS